MFLRALSIILSIIVLIGIFFGFKRYTILDNYKYKSITYKIGNKKIKLYISDTKNKILKGLSVLNKIDIDEGMIFIFSQEGKYGFWMKNMNFDIDLLWIDKNYSIIGMINNFKKETYPRIFYPSNNVKYVVELNYKAIEKYNIHTGNIIVQSK